MFIIIVIWKNKIQVQKWKWISMCPSLGCTLKWKRRWHDLWPIVRHRQRFLLSPLIFKRMKLPTESKVSLTISLELKTVKKNIWRRVVGNVPINISRSHIFRTQSAFGRCKHQWVKQQMERQMRLMLVEVLLSYLAESL